MNNVLRAGPYERVSTDEQALHGYSIATQKDTLEAYCNEKGYRIVRHYTDEGISGAKPPLKRPALKQLIDDVQAGKIDVIVFTKLDRWFRSIEEYYKVQEILDKHNVPWQAVLEDYNTATADGRLKVNIMLSVAANERERASERIKAVFDHRIKNKEVIFSCPPFGYQIVKIDGVSRLVKDPNLQDAVQEFWDMMVKENNLYKTSLYINSKYGLKRSQKSWRDTKLSTFYYGEYRGVEDYCEPYVSKEDWLRISKSKNVKKTQNCHVYLFTGLMRCPNCGTILGSTKSVNAYGTLYKFYRCKNHIDRICDYRQTVPELRTEKWLLAHLEELVNLEIEKITIAKKAAKKKARPDVAKLKEQLRKLNVMYMAGGKTDDEYMQETKVLKDLIDKASQEDTPIERDITPLKNLLKTDFKALYKDMTEEEKRRFWRTLIKEIHVEGSRIKEVIFN